MSGSEPPLRAVSDQADDDSVLPFAVEPLDVRGRLVRLGPALDEILTRHAYPPAIARLVGEAAALTALLGAALEVGRPAAIADAQRRHHRHDRR